MAGRRHGEGTVHQRADGLWVAQMSYRDGNGKRKRLTKYGKTRKEASEKLTRMQADALRGIIIEPDNTTLSSFLDTWLEIIKANRREGTYLNYEKVVRLYIKAILGGVRLSRLTALQVEALYARMRQEGASDRMCELTHAVLRCALNHAKKKRLIHENPCDLVEKPRSSSKPMKVWNAEEAKQFLVTAAEDRLHALYVLALTTGLRQGELLGLAWSEVDLEARTIRVTQQLLEHRGKLKLGPLKTEKAKRLVTLPQIAVAALQAHRKSMMEEGLRASPLVFCDTNGGPIRKSNLLRRSYKPLLMAAKVPQIRFHDLRHTAATVMLLDGINPKVVQERLGHAHISLTLGTYSHVLPSLQEEAADRIDKVLAGAL